MADGYKLWMVCPVCNGTGTNEVRVGSTANEVGILEDVVCEKCGGTKYVFFGYCSVDTFALPANLQEPPT